MVARITLITYNHYVFSVIERRRRWNELMAELCSKCKKPNDRQVIKQRYCRSCHNAYQRANRPKHFELTDEQRIKANTRSYANVYQKRGLLDPKPCHNCGSTTTIHKHHEDYSKPLDVEWLCKSCHEDHHINTT